jgi:hypothetical protein
VFQDLITTLVIVAVIALLLVALLAPLESLEWWAGWSGPPHFALDSVAEVTWPLGVTRPRFIVVYLSGIGSIAGDVLLPEEVSFLDVLEPLIPGGVIVRDVFPYSVTGVGLTGARTWAGFWRMLEHMRMGGDRLLSSFINVRNLFQVAVAADPRYGPMYACGVACVIARAAVAAGFQSGTHQRLVLLGYSGGAQVAVGTAAFLRDFLGVRVHVISLGGVLNSDAGIRVLSRLDHLVGERDVMERVGRVVYPGRWSLASRSAWNVARRCGWLHVQRLAGMAHNTPGGYMDGTAYGGADEPNPLRTARAIAAVVPGADR